jgi:hypothetical protein
MRKPCILSPLTETRIIFIRLSHLAANMYGLGLDWLSLSLPDTGL